MHIAESIFIIKDIIFVPHFWDHSAAQLKGALFRSLLLSSIAFNCRFHTTLYWFSHLAHQFLSERIQKTHISKLPVVRHRWASSHITSSTCLLFIHNWHLTCPHFHSMLTPGVNRAFLSKARSWSAINCFNRPSGESSLLFFQYVAHFET